ncbi:unnamed protein product [Hyaloperonospora brassicae]|uniref:RxLR effector candidate protein n=1 Tax=Hyaloperonospora brassicae TaxID=162125 RepID=A0AAV0UGX1_HYABA|nr:unnamed protein product [Hyaloperonospora brassicae]
MRLNSILLSAYAAPTLLMLGDGDLVCADAHNAEQTSFNESKPDYRRMHVASPADSSPTASITESHVSKKDKTVREDTRSEDRMENKLEEVLESSAQALTDVARKVKAFDRKDLRTKTMTQFYWTIPYAFNTKCTEVYEDFARGEQPMEATKLAALLIRNRDLSLTELHAGTPEIISALLSKRNPLDVTRVVVLLRSVPGMEADSDVLHRQLVANHKDLPGVISDAWMNLGLDTEELLKILNWHPDHEALFTPSFFHEVVLYIIKFKEKHLAALSIDEAIRLLFQTMNPGQVHDYLGRLEEIGGHEALVKTLRVIYANIRNHDSLLNKLRAQRLLSRKMQAEKTPDHVREFAKLAIPLEPIDAPAFAHLLKAGRRIGPKVHARLKEIVGALLFIRTPAEVVQALASLHTIAGNEAIATKMHRILAGLYLPKTMRLVWMEAGVPPRTILETCISTKDVPFDRPNGALLSEYKKFVEMYKRVHPYGINTRDA